MDDKTITLVFLDNPQLVQQRGKIEFTISAGIRLVTQSVIWYFWIWVSNLKKKNIKV